MSSGIRVNPTVGRSSARPRLVDRPVLPRDTRGAQVVVLGSMSTSQRTLRVGSSCSMRSARTCRLGCAVSRRLKMAGPRSVLRVRGAGVMSLSVMEPKVRGPGATAITHTGPPT